MLPGVETDNLISGVSRDEQTRGERVCDTQSSAPQSDGESGRQCLLNMMHIVAKIS